MSKTFDLLFVGGGVTKENDVRYLTSNTPPTDDNSNKVPTTEWVQDKLDAAVGSGMNATVKATTYSTSRNTGTTKAPSGGGTWWCYGSGSYRYHDYVDSHSNNFSFNGAFASGATVHTYTPGASLDRYNSDGFGIKIA